MKVTRTDRLPWPWLLGIALIALAGRSAHLTSTLADPLGDVLVQDAWYYHLQAVSILDAPLTGPTFMNLGYPYLIAACYRLLGPHPAAVLWVQSLFGALAAPLLALVVRLIGGTRSAAVLAGLLLALYDRAIFYDGLLLTPAPVNVVLTVGLLGVALWSRRGRLTALVVAGLALGCAVLLRANLILFLPLVAGLLLRVAPTGGRATSRARRVAAALLFVASAAAIFAPVVLYHGVVHGQWVPLISSGGMNFWVGNNRRAEGIYHAADFVASVSFTGEQPGYLAEARRLAHRPAMTPAEADRFWWGEGLREIRADPARWLRIEARKLALFWNAYETKTNVGLEFIQDFSPVLRHGTVGFGLLAVLGTAGLAHLVVERRAWPAALAGGLILVPLATCLAFFVSGEYRHPAALALCVTAGMFVASTAAALRRALDASATPGPWTTRVLPAAAGLLALALAVWPFPALVLTCHPRLDYSNYARAIGDGSPDGAPPGADRFGRASDLLARRADLQDDPFILDARLALEARAAVVLRDREHAARALAAAGRLRAYGLRPGDPAYPDRFVVESHAALERQIGILAGLDVVRRDPLLAREVALLGGNGYSEIRTPLFRGEYERALGFAREALERAPHDPVLQTLTGRALLGLGRTEEGISHLTRGLAGWPAIAEPAYDLGEFLASTGDVSRAKQALEEAIRREPGHRAAKDLLRRLEERP